MFRLVINWFYSVLLGFCLVKFRGSRMFFLVVSIGSRLNDWKMNLILLWCRVVSLVLGRFEIFILVRNICFEVM